MNKSYLSYVLHDKHVFPDVLQCFDAPTSAVLRLKDAQIKLYAFLHHSVEAIGATTASGIALIYGLPRLQSNLSLISVRHAM